MSNQPIAGMNTAQSAIKSIVFDMAEVKDHTSFSRSI
jgi:hypothetical protein